MKQEYKEIEVRGYYRKVILNGVEGKKWIAPHKRKLKIKFKIDKKQKSLDDYEKKK